MILIFQLFRIYVLQKVDSNGNENVFEESANFCKIFRKELTSVEFRSRDEYDC